MRKYFRIIKRIFQVTIMSLALLYALIYLIISLPGVQDNLRSRAEEILCEMLNVPLSISRIEFSPFNRIELFNVTIPDQRGDTLLYAKKLGVGISIDDLITHNRICLNNIQLFGMDVNITRDSLTSNTNLQFIIDAFTPDDKKEPKPIDLRINSAMIRRSSVSYDVLSEPTIDSCLFDANHIKINDLSTTINIRAFNSDSINAHIKRLSCKEQSGLTIERLSLQAIANRQQALINDFHLQLPNTRLNPRIDADFTHVHHWENFLDSTRFAIAINNSVITPSDITPLVPLLQQFHTPIHLNCHIDGQINKFDIRQLSAYLDNRQLTIEASGAVQDIVNLKAIKIKNGHIKVQSQKEGITLLYDNLGLTDRELKKTLCKIGTIGAEGSINGSLSNLTTQLSLGGDIGQIKANLSLTGDSTFTLMSGKGDIDCQRVNAALILGENSPIGVVDLSAQVTGKTRKGKLHEAKLMSQIDHLDLLQYSYNDIAIDLKMKDGCYSGDIQLHDPCGEIDINGAIKPLGKDAFANINIDCKEIDLATLNLLPQAAGNKLSFNLNANYIGNKIENANGYSHINNLFYGNSSDNFRWKQISVENNTTSDQQQITLTSDYINGKVQGQFSVQSLAHTMRNMAAQLLPSLITPTESTYPIAEKANDLGWHFTFKPHIKMAQILNLPFTLTDTARIEGYVGEQNRHMQLKVTAPNVWIGLTHLEQVDVDIIQQNDHLNLDAQAQLLNAQQESTQCALSGTAINDSIHLALNWDSHRQPIYNGSIQLGSKLSKSTQNENAIDLRVDVMPTHFTINDTVWSIKPASIDIKDKHIVVDQIEISRPSQHIYIDGTVSPNENDTLHIDLQDINLDYIFKTLNIEFVTFGGNATGRVDAANLFGDSPYLCTRKLDISNFSYNNTTFGNLSVHSMLDFATMGILLKGVISNQKKQDSYVDGYIFPTKDSISIAFDVDHAPLKFIQPFINSILIDAEGEASGHVVLEGNFERITVYGDAFAHNFSFGVPFINTRYHLSDSLHFDKDKIYFDNVTLYDEFENTAKGRGYIKHKYFTQTEYDIEIYNARKMFVFDVPRTTGIPYYGTIFGSGDVRVIGNDYNTNIAVNMTPNRNSNFTFVLTNTTSAVDYPFLSFSNKRETPIAPPKHISEIDSFVMQNNLLMERKKIVNPIQNILNLTISADIKPDSEINIVMNEMTGDKMQGYGEGLLRLDFNTADNEILMYGSMSVNKGTYDFSIEDIITRKFKIHEGGSVSFQGNPLEAKLDLSATYSLQANLADLDASFTNDSELTRTNVPVNTILLINGPLTNPDLDFRIELPTLSQDMENRMNSIINSDEMMTRQIIYLLALNRFYTAEYSSNQESYNELGAMAASTLSSSIGSLIGQLSNNWRISPQVRSERGDFTDLEVDLYLSSQLLNNRLIFNGSFGYRDSRYYTTNFIGDFDIEYLLTENGNLRLKGYNHFNDRNHTMRTAITTQGLGLIYKHDFNTWRNFFEFSNIKLFTEEEEEEEYEEYVEEDSIEQTVDSVLTITPDILE